MTAEVVPWQDDSTARALVRVQLAPEASDAELAWFANVSRQLDLSPFADQLVLVGRWDKRVGRKVHRPQITVAGRRALAERTGEVVQIDGPEWTGPRDERGVLHWDTLWTGDGTDYPYAARVFVKRRGWEKPANGTVKWSEFAQKANDGSLLPMWARMPSHMLGKTAESLALRRAFPNVIGAAEDLAGGWVGDDVVLDVQAAAGVAWEDDAHAIVVEQRVGADALDTRQGDDVGPAGPGTDAAPAGPSSSSSSAEDLVTVHEQSAAHSAMRASMTDSEAAALLERYGVTFGEVWPAALVREVLERPF